MISFEKWSHLIHQVTRTFEVKEYVAPKFEVTIKTHDFLLIDEDNIKATVCAKYTFGKRVNGVVKLQIQRTRYNGYDGYPVVVSELALLTSRLLLVY